MTLKRDGFFGALDDLDSKNAIVIAGAAVEVFLANFKLFHVITSHI